MTDDEALALKPGAVVEIIVGGAKGRWALCRVTASWQAFGATTVELRRLRLTRAGQRGNPMRRPPSGIRYPARTANVYADWLHERGHAEAAAALREAFPLVTAEGLPV